MQSEWEDITFEKRGALVPRVTVSWAKSQGAKNVQTLNINLGKALLSLMKWESGMKFKVLASRDRRVVSISRDPAGRSMQSKNSGTGVIALIAPHITIPDTIPAQAVTHTLVGDSVHITMPEWAALHVANVTDRTPVLPLGAARRSLMDMPDPAAALRGRGR